MVAKWLPSSLLSSTTVAVTLCGVFQLVELKVSVAGLKVMSPSRCSGVMVTVFNGCLVRLTT